MRGHSAPQSLLLKARQELEPHRLLDHKPHGGTTGVPVARPEPSTRRSQPGDGPLSLMRPGQICTGASSSLWTTGKLSSNW